VSSADADLKKAAELKLWLENRIAQLQDEIERLKETLGYVDANLKESTFRPAIEMMREEKEIPELRDLRQDKGGKVMATASITSEALTIQPNAEVGLRTSTPPFKSFLVSKILQGMKAKDEELVKAGKLPSGQALRFDVEDDDGMVGKLVVENYRDKARLNEIINTVSWTFSRMLEK
jgi:hypothetical protein